MMRTFIKPEAFLAATALLVSLTVPAFAGSGDSAPPPTGGHTLPATVEAAPAATNGSAPAWGVGLRAAYFGLPDWLLDLLFEQHPSVDGTIFGGELRYYGSGGPSGVFSVGLTLDVGKTDGNGVWQESAGDTPVTGGGGVDIIAGSLTLYWDLWPTAMVHPYFGLGLGAGYADGYYERDGERITVEEFIPVVHIPAGVVLGIGEHFGLGVEGRIIDGVSWGGFAQFRF